ncbi:MAG: hypothetical protein H0U36_11275 [Nocardioidaceae bacterium]|nr:hypothetical protein [Nocardioidaceae bacterium]
MQARSPWWVAMLALVGVTLLGLTAAAVLLAVAIFGSGDSASDDPHGYVGIFGVVGLVVLLLPTMLLVSAATDLRRRKKGGFVWGAAGGVILAFLSTVLSRPESLGLLVLGLSLIGTGLFGRLRARHESTSAE